MKILKNTYSIIKKQKINDKHKKSIDKSKKIYYYDYIKNKERGFLYEKTKFKKRKNRN